MYYRAYCTGPCEALPQPHAVWVCNNALDVCEQMTIHADGEPFDVSDLDPAQLSAAFAAGFAIVGTAWAIGRGFRALLSMIGR